MDFKYPYTDFHELNLDWFLAEFKKLVEEWNTLSDDNATFKHDMELAFSNLDSTVQTFTNFVTNYFDNLDVQQEVNNKLNEMAADGTLTDLLQPIFDEFMSDTTTKLVSLQAQINEIVAPDPDPSLAEVSTARVDLDGYAHSTLKARCDSDALKVQDSDKFMYTASIKSLITEPGGISITTGAENNAASVVNSYVRSAFIPVCPGYVIEYTKMRIGANLDIIAVYDGARTYQQAESIEAPAAISNASGKLTITRFGYVRLTCANTVITDATVNIYSKSQIYMDQLENQIYRVHQFSMPNNVVDDTAWTVGWITASGEVTTGNSAIITATDFPLTGEVIVRKEKTAQLNIFAYVNGTFSRRIPADATTTEIRFTPDNTETYRICFYRVPYETATVNSFLHYFTVGYAADILLDNFSKVSGKKWVTIGDSLTADSTLSTETEKENYTEIVARALNLNLENEGVSGTGYWRKSTVSPFKAFFQVANTISADADIITVFGSFNDMGRDGPILGRDILGTIYDETTDTVGGCINQAFQNIFTRCPNAVVGVILPTPWHDMTKTQAELVVYEPYVNLVKGVAERYSLPVLDLFHHSDLRPWDDTFKATYYKDADGVHPNHFGHLRIAGYICDFVESLAKLI